MIENDLPAVEEGVWPIGTTVEFPHSGGQYGVVLAIMISEGERYSYKVSYWQNGQRQECWVTSLEVEGVDPDEPPSHNRITGFNNGNGHHDEEECEGDSDDE